MKFDDLKRVNDTIVTMDVKGKPYALVNERIKAFRMLYPEGAIETELLSNENGICVIKATVSKKINDAGIREVLGTGTAYEKEGSTFINKTSYIENCETSAVGRALAMCGIGIDTSIASAEEVQNAIANQDRGKLLVKISKLMNSKNIMPNEPSEHFGKGSNEMTVEELQEVVKWLEGK